MDLWGKKRTDTQQAKDTSIYMPKKVLETSPPSPSSDRPEIHAEATRATEGAPQSTQSKKQGKRIPSYVGICANFELKPQGSKGAHSNCESIPQILAETACHRPSNVEASTEGSKRPHRSPPKSGKLAESLTIVTWNVMAHLRHA